MSYCFARTLSGKSFDGVVAPAAAVDPTASMQAVDNPRLARIAATVRRKLEHVIGAV